MSEEITNFKHIRLHEFVRRKNEWAQDCKTGYLTKGFRDRVHQMEDTEFPKK